MSWRCLLAALSLFCLPSCLLVGSTGPTTISGADIVFVATGDGGLRIATLLVTVTEVRGDWRREGSTSLDGRFRCDVPSGVTRVRVAAVPPPNYALADAWPREFTLQPGATLDVDVRVTGQGQRGRRASAPQPGSGG